MACPHCGERIRRTAPSCRHCGSDDTTGWSEATYMDGIDLPDEGDYEEGLREEGFKPRARDSKQFLLAGVSTLILLIFALWLFRGLF